MSSLLWPEACVFSPQIFQELLEDAMIIGKDVIAGEERGKSLADLAYRCVDL